MELKIIFSLLAMHWWADFVMQTDYQAKNKSKKMKALLMHTAIYSLSFFAVTLIMNWDYANGALYFMLITFAAHTITDYFTSRLNSYLWEKGNAHNFFVSVGFDQLLHYAQLLLTYQYLFSK